MKEIFAAMDERMSRGKDCVWVSIIASSGSTPRGMGAHMLVTEQGLVCGTIGGGEVEHRAIEMAKQVLAEKHERIHSFILRKNQIQDIGMICGGDVTVYFRYIGAEDEKLREIARQALKFFETGTECWTLFDVTTGEIALYGKEGSFWGDELPVPKFQIYKKSRGLFQEGTSQYYAEQIVRGGRVYIFGGGHVAQKLVPVLSGIQFRCVVLEDREDFCRPELFPGAEETRCVDLDRLEEMLNITEQDYICIMTRGHKDDLTAQAFAMKTSARYIGVIGSRKKTAAITEKLRAQGFTEEDFARIITPIGLDIGGETPEEIAISIAAQLIAVRAGKIFERQGGF